MNRTFRTALISIIGTVVALAVAGLIVVYSGTYDVNADEAHSPFVRWALRTTTVHAVRAHAADVDVPADVNLQDPQFAAKAAGHYDEMCSACHGAPGKEPAHWVALYPDPPEFEHPEMMHASWKDTELFWIIKHGIKDTGMSAFGEHEEDEDLWALTAFLRQIPDLSPAKYQTLVKQNPAPDEHENGGDEHEESARGGARSKPGESGGG